MRTLPGRGGQSTRQPSALSDGLEMKFAPEVDGDGDLGMQCLLPLPLFTFSSVSSLYLHPVSPPVLTLQSAPPRGSWTPY